MPNNRKIKEMTSLITQKDQIIAQMRAELSTTIEEDRYYTEENITDCNAHLEAFLAQLKKSNQASRRRRAWLDYQWRCKGVSEAYCSF